MAESTSRFKAPSSDKEFEELCKTFVPKNTKKATTWAMNVFHEWKAERNRLALEKKEEIVPDNLFTKPDHILLNHWLCRFVDEVRKKDGSHYPPRSIHLMLAGLQRIILEKDPTSPRFFERHSTSYRELQSVCDHTYRKLRDAGVGVDIKSTSVFTLDEENKLWSSNTIGIDTPKQLQRAVFYYIGKCYCIRGGEEQRKLCPSQFVRSSDPDCYTYMEHGSKNITGGLAQLKQDNKRVPCYAVPGSIPRCLVYLLDLYLGKLPLYAFQANVLYCRPKKDTPNGESAWYDSVPVGKNTLGTMVRDMCAEAGIEKKTNHSLRATGATAMFSASIPEKIIQNSTGHRTLESLRKYEKTSIPQHQAVSSLLMTGKEPCFNQPSRMFQSHSQYDDSGAVVRSVLGSIENCTIQSLTINYSSTAKTETE